LVWLPPPSTTHQSVDPTKRCNYHQNLSNTEECFKVWDLFESVDPTKRCNYHQNLSNIEECFKVWDLFEELV